MVVSRYLILQKVTYGHIDRLLQRYQKFDNIIQIVVANFYLKC